MAFSRTFVTDFKPLLLRAQVFWSTLDRHPMWKIQGFPASELLHHRRPSNPKGRSVLTCLSKYAVCLITDNIQKISMWVSTKQRACFSRNNFSKVPFKGHTRESPQAAETSFGFSNQPHDAPKLTFRSGFLEQEFLPGWTGFLIPTSLPSFTLHKGEEQPRHWDTCSPSRWMSHVCPRRPHYYQQELTMVPVLLSPNNTELLLHLWPGGWAKFQQKSQEKSWLSLPPAAS